MAIEPLCEVRKWGYVMWPAFPDANHRDYEENSSSGTEQVASEPVVGDCSDDS
jgi:hypothetical protein